MKSFHIEESRPSWYKGLGPIYTIHNEEGEIRALKYDYEPDAIAVCKAMNEGKPLLADLRFKLNGKSQEAQLVTHLSSAEDALYYHVQDKLGGTSSMSLDHDVHKAQALREAGYSEPVVNWGPVTGD